MPHRQDRVVVAPLILIQYSIPIFLEIKDYFENLRTALASAYILYWIWHNDEMVPRNVLLYTILTNIIISIITLVWCMMWWSMPWPFQAAKNILKYTKPHRSLVTVLNEWKFVRKIVNSGFVFEICWLHCITNDPSLNNLAINSSWQYTISLSYCWLLSPCLWYGIALRWLACPIDFNMNMTDSWYESVFHSKGENHAHAIEHTSPLDAHAHAQHKMKFINQNS